ncbi:MAG: c-type cytochrome [Cyanothece sp. SIO2G6]|nr:c-type cytochrome [Cyanothece sp. SIO2G6]
MRSLMIVVLIISAWITLPLPSHAEPSPSSADGASLFTLHCAGCHPGGGNIVRRGKTLKLRDLKRQHVDSVEAIATITTNGKGLMSAYSERLTPEEITIVSNYVWQQAQQNWKQR